MDFDGIVTYSKETTNGKELKRKATEEVEYKEYPNGDLQVDFWDKKAKFQQFYDTTRLIVHRKPLNVQGIRVYECDVSWYGHFDCHMTNPTTGEFESPRAQNYVDILTDIDLELLQKDTEYCNMVMRGLLEQKRVEKYIKTGLQEITAQPCGKYIGGVINSAGVYRETFSTVVGYASHNSKEMIIKRKENKINEIEYRRSQIEKPRREIKGIEDR